MPKIAIVTDTGCDMPETLRQQYGFQTIPLEVRFGNEAYLEGELSLEAFWAKIHSGGRPGTSQPATGRFEEAFASWIKQGYDVLCMTITGKHSGTFNSAYAASRSFPGHVTIYDTQSLSLAQSYQVIAASKAAAEGLELPQIMARVESIRDRTHMFIGLDTIEFLKAGGRADSVMPVLERAVRVLHIKPTLSVIEGQLKFQGVDRSHDRSVRRIRDEVLKHAPAEALIVLHTRVPDEALKLARELSTALNFPFEQTLIGEAGPVLSCHAGPGVVAAAIVTQASTSAR